MSPAHAPNNSQTTSTTGPQWKASRNTQTTSPGTPGYSCQPNTNKYSCSTETYAPVRYPSSGHWLCTLSASNFLASPTKYKCPSCFSRPSETNLHRQTSWQRRSAKDSSHYGSSASTSTEFPAVVVEPTPSDPTTRFFTADSRAFWSDHYRETLPLASASTITGTRNKSGVPDASTNNRTIHSAAYFYRGAIASA